jgi:hypothetical protein
MREELNSGSWTCKRVHSGAGNTGIHGQLCMDCCMGGSARLASGGRSGHHRATPGPWNPATTRTGVSHGRVVAGPRIRLAITEEPPGEHQSQGPFTTGVEGRVCPRGLSRV